MKKLVLNELESLELQELGWCMIVRDGFYILIQEEKDHLNPDYSITIFNPYDEIVMTQTKEIRENEK